MHPKMRYNPFQPNQIVAPGMFTGRIEEVLQIERYLYQGKLGNPQHFLIEGERGIGKSSLIFYVSAFAAGRVTATQGQRMNFALLSVDLANVTAQIDIVRAIARALKSEAGRISKVKEGAKKVWDFLSNWEILGVRYHKDGANYDPDDARDVLIEQIIALCENEDAALDGVFIVIDEADTPPVDAGLGEFVKTFTERLTKSGCNKVVLGLAGLPSLLTKLRQSHESSPRIFHVLTLEPLEFDERKEVVKKGLAAANTKNGFETKVSDSALDLLADLSEGYPHFVQQFSYSAFEKDDDDIIDSNDVIEGAYEENGAIAQLGSKYFNEMYFGKISSEDYRKVLDTMAQHGDEWVPRKQIIAESSLSNTTITNALNALKSRNIILSDTSRQGFYRLPTKSFAAWINAIKSVELRKEHDEMPLLEGGGG